MDEMGGLEGLLSGLKSSLKVSYFLFLFIHFKPILILTDRGHLLLAKFNEFLFSIIFLLSRDNIFLILVCSFFLFRFIQFNFMILIYD